jgi:hypothetical protein
MTPADQVIINYGIIIMQFPVGNAMVIQDMINRISITTPSISTY